MLHDDAPSRNSINSIIRSDPHATLATNGSNRLGGQEANQDNAENPTGAIDWSQCPVVESVPGKVSGAWVLKGTRMPVSAIFENLETGANIDDIMEWFAGLDRSQVEAVIEFAVRSLDKPPSYAL